MAVLNHYGIEVDYERFLETYTPHWYDSYERLGLAREEWENADRMWRKDYLSRTSDLFPFTIELLETLHRAGRTLGLVTSGDRDRVTRELKRLEVADYFAAVVCHEDTEKKKPHPAPLQHALSQIDVAPESTVFVGDRPEDIEMGRVAGTFTVAVESEYGPRAVLEEATPDCLLKDASHLPAKLGL